MDWDAVFFALSAAGLVVGALSVAAAISLGRSDAAFLLGMAAGLLPLSCWLAERVTRSAHGTLRHSPAPVHRPRSHGR